MGHLILGMALVRKYTFSKIDFQLPDIYLLTFYNLRRPKSGIFALTANQVPMRTQFYQFSFIQYKDRISIFYRTKPVGNDNNCFSMLA